MLVYRGVVRLLFTTRKFLELAPPKHLGDRFITNQLMTRLLHLRLGESVSRPGVVPETPPFRSRSAQLHATGVTGAVGACVPWLISTQWMFPKIMVPHGTPKSSILIGFFIIFTIHFGVFFPYCWKHPCIYALESRCVLRD